MVILITGGAGFIGRWVVKRFLEDGYEVKCLDNLSNGSAENIKDLDKKFIFYKGDIRNIKDVEKAFDGAEVCIHLAAQINVQESLENPEKSYENNVLGTYNVLEECRRKDVKLVFVGTCMVYDIADASKPISEEHSILPRSPYAATKLAAEELALGYYHGYGLPVVITRPFNTYGPFQKSNMEGGVVSIFIKRFLEGKTLQIYGDGTQTRDLLYVEDCADFIAEAALNKKAVGEIINAGSGRDVSINELAFMICKDEKGAEHVPHHHPQSDIQKLVCDYSKAKKLLGWKPKTSLEDGIKKTIRWIKKEQLQ